MRTKKAQSAIGLFVATITLTLIGCGRSPSARRSVARPTPADPWFVDVTTQAGIDFRHVNGATGRFYYPETNGSGCAWFDADGDGWLDAFLVNAMPLPGCPPQPKVTSALYLNNRDGTLRNATRGSGLEDQFYGTGCAVGDYDNDGRPDLYVAAVLGPGHLYRNLGGGRFKDVTAQAGVQNKGHWGTACTWIDYDRDGLLDLFIGNYVQYKLGSDTPCLYAEGYKTYCGPRWFQPDSPRLYRNLDGRRFRDVSAEVGLLKVRGKALGVVMLDYNRDGWPDLFVANDVWEQHLLANEGRGRKRRYREVGVEAGVALSENGKELAGMGVDAIDLLGDGRLWIATANFSGEGVAIYRQHAPGENFSDVSRLLGLTQASLPNLGFGLAWLDTDNNGLKELCAANGHVHPEIQKHQPHLRYEQPKQLFEWDGRSRFRDVTAQAGSALLESTVSRGMAAGDYDNDGKIDLLVNNLNRPPQLLRNTRPSSFHWLGIQLEGRRSNRSGYGAEVTVRAGARRWRDWCRSGGSYVSHNDSRLHFGLGDAQQADEITIRWPGGKTDVIRNVPADRYYRVVEGSGTAAPVQPASPRR